MTSWAPWAFRFIQHPIGQFFSGTGMLAFDGRSVRRQTPSIQSMWIGTSPQQFTGGGSSSASGSVNAGAGAGKDAGTAIGAGASGDSGKSAAVTPTPIDAGAGADYMAGAGTEATS